ncbi:ACT domain-containing protein [Oerskovia sp. M15]
MPAQKLRLLDAFFTLEHQPHTSFPDDDEWVALVRAPRTDGPARGVALRWRRRTVGRFLRRPHGLDMPGMLAAIVGPLAEASIAVFVASTYHADLVLVPEGSVEAAVDVLVDAGHRVTRGPGRR